MSKIAYIDNMENWMSDFSFSCPIKVRFSETDMFGHLNNTVPFTYFEMARIEYFKHLGFMQDWLKPDNETIPVVADLQCDFLKQVFFDQEIDVFVKARNIGNSSMDIHYMGKGAKGDILFTGRGAIVQISRFTGRAVLWSTEAKKLLVGS